MINENLNYKEFFDNYGRGIVRLFMESGECPFIKIEDLYIAFKERFATELLIDMMQRLAEVEDRDKNQVIADMIKSMKKL